MRRGARIAAAIEVLDDMAAHHRPIATALAEWGKAHRFAGSGDRNAIGHLVYDAMRYRAASAHMLGEDTPRALVLGAALAQGSSAADISAMCSGDDHCPAALTADELKRLESPALSDAPSWVVGNYPEWMHPSFERAFGASAADEGRALAARAPADLRVNTLKATREKVMKALESFRPTETHFAKDGIRIPAPLGDSRIPNLEAEAAFQAGWFEIQDEGSQIAAALSGATVRQQVLDLCAGAGGKTLAMSAAMQNTGQIFAYDSDRNRLKAIFARLKRANARNIQVLRAGDTKALEKLGDRFDVVLVDAPCTGTGTWRRRPDAKWRVRPGQLAERQREQREVLETAAAYVKPGGRLIYVTCSILPEENTDQVAAFTERHADFEVVPFAAVWQEAFGTVEPQSADRRSDSLLLTPASHETDGFFIAIMRRVKTAQTMKA